ncbi:hypothetical protein LEMLEM_LOCUS25752 [Lemmus lemmus]
MELRGVLAGVPQVSSRRRDSASTLADTPPGSGESDTIRSVDGKTWACRGPPRRLRECCALPGRWWACSFAQATRVRVRRGLGTYRTLRRRFAAHACAPLLIPETRNFQLRLFRVSQLVPCLRVDHSPSKQQVCSFPLSSGTLWELLSQSTAMAPFCATLDPGPIACLRFLSAVC